MLFWISMWMLAGLISLVAGELLDYFFDAFHDPDENVNEDYVLGSSIFWITPLFTVLGLITTVVIGLVAAVMTAQRLVHRLRHREFLRIKKWPYRQED